MVIYIDERPVSGKMAARGDIAMVFQNYALYPHMSVYDNIAYSLKIKGVPKKEIRERVARVAHILELESVLKKKPSQLSGGQKQRVAMGRAIIRTPKLFLMDEPLSNLDAKLRTQMRKEISKLYRDSSSTYIYVTHDPDRSHGTGNQNCCPESLDSFSRSQHRESFMSHRRICLWRALSVRPR